MPQATQQSKGRVAVGSHGLLPNVGLCSLRWGAPGVVDKPGSEHEACLSHLGLVPCPLRPPFPCLPTGESRQPCKPPRCWTKWGRDGQMPHGVIIHLDLAGYRSRSHDSAPQPWKCGGAPAPPGGGGPQAGAPPGGGAEGAAAAQSAHGFLSAEADLPQQVGASGTPPCLCPTPRVTSRRGEAQPCFVEIPV